MAYVPSLLKLINSAHTRVQLLLQLRPQDRTFSEAYMIRYLKDDNSWGYVPLVQATREMPHTSKRRKVETVPVGPFSELKPPPDENWIFFIFTFLSLPHACLDFLKLKEAELASNTYLFPDITALYIY
jgi:hypothetical protein